MTKPDEFDLNFILDFKKLPIRVVRDPTCTPSYVQLMVENPERKIPMNSELYGLVPKLMKLLEHGHENHYYIMSHLVRKWINSVVDKSLAQIKGSEHFYGISHVTRSLRYLNF